MVNGFNGKIDQLAFISHSESDTGKIKETLGLSDAKWIKDEVVAKGTVRGQEASNTAVLLFNYDMGIEVEILQYVEGNNYASNLASGRLCHYGIHYSGEGEVPTFNADIVQQVETQSHTNPFLLESGRRYRYTIYNTMNSIGVFTKVIERIQ